MIKTTISRVHADVSSALVSRKVVLLAVIAAYICLIDRVAMSIAIIPMATEFGWSPAHQGSVMAAFFVGYVVLQLPAGWLSDRLGGKWVLGVGVVAWSLFTLLTPSAASIGLALLLCCRFFMGVAESVTWPSIYNLFTLWVPDQQRGFAVGLLNSAISGGTIIALVMTPWLIDFGGWRFAFWAYGTLGLMWFVVWAPGIPNRRSVASVDCDDTAAYRSLTVRNALASRPVIAMMVAHFCTNWLIYLSLAWLPTFLNQAHAVPLSDVGYWVVLPFLVSTIATPLTGRFADRLIARGVTRLTVRRAMQCTALLGVAAVFLLVGYIEQVSVVVALFCLGNLAASGAVAGIGANPMELAPQHAATLYGASNALASLGSAGAVFVAGQILENTGSWTLVFQSAAVIGIVGALIYYLWSGVERQF